MEISTKHFDQSFSIKRDHETGDMTGWEEMMDHVGDPAHVESIRALLCSSGEVQRTFEVEQDGKDPSIVYVTNVRTQKVYNIRYVSDEVTKTAEFVGLPSQLNAFASEVSPLNMYEGKPWVLIRDLISRYDISTSFTKKLTQQLRSFSVKPLAFQTSQEIMTSGMQLDSSEYVDDNDDDA